MLEVRKDSLNKRFVLFLITALPKRFGAMKAIWRLFLGVKVCSFIGTMQYRNKILPERKVLEALKSLSKADLPLNIESLGS